ncbi:MAG TPA: GNAT family N-acetyltransferase [Solirubrobacteraceae bacterium]|jgi:ribosomal protein S18 acetylase RimI-like enzyme
MAQLSRTTMTGERGRPGAGASGSSVLWSFTTAASPPALLSLQHVPWLIRPASETDFDAVLELWRAAGSPPSSSDTLSGLGLLLSADPGALLLADSGEDVVGSVIAAWDGWRGSFYRLAVHPDNRRAGVARDLLNAGEQRLRDLGAVRLTAIVAEDDLVAMGFWQAVGYQRQSHRARFIKEL